MILPYEIHFYEEVKIAEKKTEVRQPCGKRTKEVDEKIQDNEAVGYCNPEISNQTIPRKCYSSEGFCTGLWQIPACPDSLTRPRQVLHCHHLITRYTGKVTCLGAWVENKTVQTHKMEQQLDNTVYYYILLQGIREW